MQYNEYGQHTHTNVILFFGYELHSNYINTVCTGMCECSTLSRLRMKNTFFGHIVSAYANFCSVKKHTVMRNS